MLNSEIGRRGRTRLPAQPLVGQKSSPRTVRGRLNYKGRKHSGDRLNRYRQKVPCLRLGKSGLQQRKKISLHKDHPIAHPAQICKNGRLGNQGDDQAQKTGSVRP